MAVDSRKNGWIQEWLAGLEIMVLLRMALAYCFQAQNFDVVPKGNAQFDEIKEVGRFVGNDQITELRLKDYSRKHQISLTFWNHISEYGEFFGVNAHSLNIEALKSIIQSDIDLRSNIRLYGDGVDGGKFFEMPRTALRFDFPLQSTALKIRIGKRTLREIVNVLSNQLSLRTKFKAQYKFFKIALFQRPKLESGDSENPPIDIFVSLTKARQVVEMHRFQMIYSNCYDCGLIEFWPSLHTLR